MRLPLLLLEGSVRRSSYSAHVLASSSDLAELSANVRALCRVSNLCSTHPNPEWQLLAKERASCRNRTNELCVWFFWLLEPQGFPLCG